MPNLRTTVVKKIKAYQIPEDSHIKVGGRWYTVASNLSGYTTTNRRHLTLVPEGGSDDYVEQVNLMPPALVKFKVRVPK